MAAEENKNGEEERNFCFQQKSSENKNTLFNMFKIKNNKTLTPKRSFFYSLYNSLALIGAFSTQKIFKMDALERVSYL